MALGVWSAQLGDAAEYYLKLKADHPNADITFVGHSLGGGLASLLAVFFDEDAMTFDQAPFRNAATASIAQQLADYLSDKFPPELWLNPLYQFIYGEDTLANREAKVSDMSVQGEFLSQTLFDRIGDRPPLTHGTSDLALAGDLHSIALLEALLVNPEFQDVTYELPDVIRMIFNKDLYHPNDNEGEDFIKRLVRHEFGNAPDVDAPDAMLTRYTNDLQKLAQDGGLTMVDFDGSNNVSKTLIAFAMQMYYEGPNATDSNKELFTKIAGGVQFDWSDVAAALYESKGYDLYFKRFLDSTYTSEEREPIDDILPKLHDWYVQASAEALNAQDSKNSGAFMLGGSGDDKLTGGSSDDLLLGNLGNDTPSTAAKARTRWKAARATTPTMPPMGTPSWTATAKARCGLDQ